MATVTKRRKAAREKLKAGSVYSVDDALALVKEFASAKFPESVDISINLGVDPRKSDQVVRGSTVLPNGTGKTVRVAVFTQGENAEKAKAAGADIVGFEDLAEKVKAGEMNFDVVIATPDAMRVVGMLVRNNDRRKVSLNPLLRAIRSRISHNPFAVDVDHEPAGELALGAHRGGQAEAHRAQAAGGDHLPRTAPAIKLGGPHLVLAHAGDDDGAAGQLIGVNADQPIRPSGDLSGSHASRPVWESGKGAGVGGSSSTGDSMRPVKRIEPMTRPARARR